MSPWVRITVVAELSLLACGHAGPRRDPRETSTYANMRVAADRFNLKVCECRTGYCNEYYSVTEAERQEYACAQRAYDAVDPQGSLLHCYLHAAQRSAQCVSRLGCDAAPLEACMDQLWEAEDACTPPTAEQQLRLNDIASACLGRPFVVFDPRERNGGVEE